MLYNKNMLKSWWWIRLLMKRCLRCPSYPYIMHGRRPGAEFGGTRKFFADFSGKNFHFHAEKFWWPFFSHWPGFSDFDSLFSDSLCLYCIECRISWPLLHNKNPSFNKKFLDGTYFFTLFKLSRPSHNTRLLLKILEGTNAWAVPPPQILRGLSPPFPRAPRSPPLVITHALLCWTL